MHNEQICEQILQKVAPELRPQAQALVQEKQQTEKISFSLKALLFVGSLFGAILLVSSSSLLIIFGLFLPQAVIFCSLGWFLLYRWRDDEGASGVFLRQLGSLFALGGQILFLEELKRWLGLQYDWLAVIIIAAGSYPLFRSSFNRFLWCAMAVSLCCCKLIDGLSLGVNACGLIGLGLFAAAAGIFIKRLFSFYPLAYALLWSCAWMGGLDIAAHWDGQSLNGVNMVLAVLAGVYLYKALSGQKQHWLGIVAGAVCALVLNWPSVLALAAVYLGYRLRESILEWAGLAGLACGLIVFYFSLEMSLTLKSVFLVGPGALMLWARSVYAK